MDPVGASPLQDDVEKDSFEMNGSRRGVAPLQDDVESDVFTA